VEYLDDVVDAIRGDATEYFLGLIVLVDMDDSMSKRYEILDGQQQLATTTMIYAAIRHWLTVNGFNDDATRIQSDFIGISEIGENEHEPRIVMNIDNREIFQEIVVNQCSDELIERRKKDSGRHSSMRKLVEATAKCREYISTLAAQQEGDRTNQAKILFELARYIRDKVQVNCLDVNSPENAYTIFESLNDRGIDLSVLDLLKNHIFREAGQQNQSLMQRNWTRLLAHLGDGKSDIFLKAFWTSRYGRIQRGRLFHELKQMYPNRTQVLSLSSELANIAETYADLDIADSELWRQYSAASQEHIHALSILGSLQTRPILLAALERFSPEHIERLLDRLLTLIVRYQLIGRGRTGRLEISAAAAAEGIYSKRLLTPQDVWQQLRPIIPPNEEFEQDFIAYEERDATRARWLLRELELERWRQQNPNRGPQVVPLTDPNKVNLEHILPKNPDNSWDLVKAQDADVVRDCCDRFGNLCLLDKASNKKEAARAYQAKAQAVYATSEFLLTKELSTQYQEWNRMAIEERQ
jgi:hypothetical protein